MHDCTTPHWPLFLSWPPSLQELKSKSLLKGLPLQIPMHRPDLFPIPPRKHQRTPSTFVPSIASLPSPKTQQSPYHATTNAGSSSDDGRPQVDPHADAALEMYTFLVTVVHRTRQSRDVQDIFAMMHADGVAPNEPILSRLCGAVAHGKDAAAAYRLYCYIVESGGELDMFMYRHIIAALISTAEARVWWPVTLRILHRMHMAIPMAMETDVQTSLVVAAGRGGWHAELLELYKLMLQDAVLPGTITFNACKCSTCRRRVSHTIFLNLLHFWHHMFAWKIFLLICASSAAHAVITGALRSGRPRLGFAFGDAMVSMGCPPDEGTFSALLTCCTALKDVAAAQRYWALMHEHGVRPDRIACSSYMWSCLSGGRYDLVTQFYEDWQRSSRPPGTSKDAMSPPSYHELCQWLAKARRWTKLRIALDLQRFMRSQKLDPGKLTLEDIQKRAETDDPTGQWAQAAAVVSKVASRNEGTMAPSAAAMSFAVTAYASMGNVARAREVAELMSRTEMGDDRMAYATCLDACGGAGGATAASRLLIRAHDAGLRLDSSAYTSAIAACLPDGRVDLASQVLEVMKDGGVAANIITLNCALAVCVAAGDTARALIIFKGLESVWGATPNTITYATVAEGLAKAGRWGDAIKFIVIGEALGQARLPLMGPGRSEAECAPGLRAACMTTPPGISIDLHGMSVMAARAAVRGWLAVLRQAAFSGELAREPQPEHHGIVTGQGRNSKDGASKLRPAIEEILSGALGPAVAYSTQPWNQGALLIRAEDMLQWVKNPELDLGLGGSVEEKKLAELIRDPSPTAAILAEVD